MRIADKMNFDQVNATLGKNRTDMAELQNQAATQKKLTKPSDDPLAATRVLQTRTEIEAGKQFLKSVGQAKNFLEYSDQSLGELAEVFMRAKELAISQSNDASASESTRQVAATEVEQLFAQSVQVGNRKQGDRFLFGGFRTTRPPFDANGNYKGDSGEMKITINKEAQVAMNMPGDRIFLGKSVQTPSGTTPPTPGENRDPKVDPQPTHGNDPAVRPAKIRAPASRFSTPNEAAAEMKSADGEEPNNLGESWKTKGTNVFKVLSDLEIALRANDKQSVQESLDHIDEALAQVVIARSTLGARAQTLTSAMESLQKGQVDAKTLQSNLEDADTFELVSDINKTESTLKASLQTSGKLIQPSLLDFLR
ncbi:MAG: flagellar hook-associated protein FlgL [Bdellovibrionota bacterium]